VNTEVASGVALSVTVEPFAKLWVHETLQFKPAGALVTLPPPPPAIVNVIAFASSKSPLTDFAESMVTTQVGTRPEQPPPVHPLKMEPPAAVAVSVTVPTLKLFTQVAPQLIPDGALVMLPCPLPLAPAVRVTVSVWLVLAKSAVTLVKALMVTTHVPVPEHPPPLQPAPPVNVEFGPGVAVKVTTAPCAKNDEQVAPQEIPDGLLVTVPVPVPVTPPVLETSS
jgi:hypothetical protein